TQEMCCGTDMWQACRHAHLWQAGCEADLCQTGAKPKPTCCKPKATCASPKATDAVPAPKSLYERLGGEAAIKAVVAKFVARAASNEKVNFFRKGTDKEWKPGEGDVAKLQEHLVNLVGSLTGGPQKYTGREMKTIHKGMKITKAEFGAIAADLSATLKEFKVPQKEHDELIGIVATTAKDIVEE
ncbi:MAG: hypothetical protein CMJ78_23845, partial [Planctomycetaceae bacterium]|nr:hypothetical protein [Planctomycetaceae bacterium]